MTRIAVPRCLAPLVLGLVIIFIVALGERSTARQQPASAEALIASAPVQRAVGYAKAHEEQVISEQIALCEVPAPPFAEQARGLAYKAAFERLGLENVRVDAAGNVLGERPGKAPRPHVVISAHLDTVFPEGTSVRTSRTGTVIKGPGISDDCRGLAAVLGAIRALNDAAIETPGSITFVGTVGEEGLGDLRGVKHLFDQELKGRIDSFVSVDGAGTSITATAVGSRRYRVAYRGSGGHSYGAFGLANPIHALGRAIAAISDLDVPSTPKTTFNVGRIGGGTSINSISAEAWMEVDMRSADREALATLDARVSKALGAALAAENARWNNNGQLTLEKRQVGDRPAGRTPPDSPIVKAALAASAAVGMKASMDENSTDSNVAMALRVPAVTIDGGGAGSGSHSLDESFDTTDSWQGTARVAVLAIALAR